MKIKILISILILITLTPAIVGATTSNITNLTSMSGPTYINWSWKNPTNQDFNHTEIYFDGNFVTNTILHYYNTPKNFILDQWTMHNISLRLVNTSGKVGNWTNGSARTKDIEKPVIHNVVLNNTIPETGDSILVTVNVTDNIGVILVKANEKSLSYRYGTIWNGTIKALNGTHYVNITAKDVGGNIAYNNSTSYTATGQERIILATVIVVRPRTLNIESKGKFTIFVILPDGYKETDVNLNTIQANGISPIKIKLLKRMLILKFNREDFMDILDVEDKITVSGELVDGTYFEGSDIIDIIKNSRDGVIIKEKKDDDKIKEEDKKEKDDDEVKEKEDSDKNNKKEKENRGNKKENRERGKNKDNRQQ